MLVLLASCFDLFRWHSTTPTHPAAGKQHPNPGRYKCLCVCGLALWSKSPEWVGVLHNYSSTINSFSRPQAVVVVARFFCVLLHRVRRERISADDHPPRRWLLFRFVSNWAPVCLCVIRFRFGSSSRCVLSGVSAKTKQSVIR